jgi:poly-gamma-glutamate synthesis protein (capsule biosynthesis protein)
VNTLITILLCGDLMTGRGIDQILLHPSDPTIYERYVKDARVYVEIAEEKNGPIPRTVEPDYIWGDALHVLSEIAPDVRIVNLETSVTTSNDYWKGKGINYRMHPKNISCLTAAKLDCCTLANNHVMDWGHEGLSETLKTLQKAGISFAGAGPGLGQARSPAVLRIEGKGRVLVFSYGTRDSEWLTEVLNREGRQFGTRVRLGDEGSLAVKWD